MLTVIRRKGYTSTGSSNLPQMAGLMFPYELVIIGNQLKTYEWAENLYENLNKPEAFKKFQKASQKLDE